MKGAYQNSSPQRPDSPARLHYMTRDRKLAPVVQGEYAGNRHRPEPRAPYCSATYVSIEATCPSSCRFKGNGCYVTARILDDAAREQRLDGDAVIEVEAQLIERAFKGQGGQVVQDGAG